MKPSAIRAAGVKLLEETKLRGPRFRHMTVRPDIEAGAVPDRHFFWALARQPLPDDVMGPEDLRTITYILTVYYVSTPDVEDRIGDDADVIVTLFDGMFRLEPDIQEIRVTPTGVGDPSPQQVTSIFTLTIGYRRDL